MEAIPRIRRPRRCTPSTRWWRRLRGSRDVGVTADNLVGAQCRRGIGLGNAKDDTWKSASTCSASGHDAG